MFEIKDTLLKQLDSQIASLRVQIGRQEAEAKLRQAQMDKLKTEIELLEATYRYVSQT
jgi:hypothetical protein